MKLFAGVSVVGVHAKCTSNDSQKTDQSLVEMFCSFLVLVFHG